MQDSLSYYELLRLCSLRGSHRPTMLCIVALFVSSFVRKSHAMIFCPEPLSNLSKRISVRIGRLEHSVIPVTHFYPSFLLRRQLAGLGSMV